jgi:hypothetical protein
MGFVDIYFLKNAKTWGYVLVKDLDLDFKKGFVNNMVK